VDGTGLVHVSDPVDGGRAGRTTIWPSGWGTTLARIHAIQPADAPDPMPYGIVPAPDRGRWAIAGTERGLARAPVLRRRMDDVGGPVPASATCSPGGRA
jgi:hypothetical protein